MTADVWSPSRVSCYRSCPQQEALRYRRSDAPSSRPRRALVAPQLLAGTISHAGLEAAYKAAARQSERLAPNARMSRFATIAMAAINETWGRLIPIEDDEQDDSDDVSLLPSIQAEVLNVLDRLPVPSPLHVLGVEFEVRVSTPGGRIEHGVIDLALRVGSDAIHIRDWKRSRIENLPRRGDLPRHDALAFYRFAAATYWPWAKRVTGGLFSTLSNREISASMPLDIAREVVIGHDFLAEKAENDRERRPTPNGENCMICSVRDDCPLWVSAARDA